MRLNNRKPEEQLTFAQLVAAPPAGRLARWREGPPFMRGPADAWGNGRRARADAVAPERGLVFSGTYTLPAAPFSFGAHAVAVEVNRETGAVRILRYVGVHDCGRIVNPRWSKGKLSAVSPRGSGRP